MVSTSTSRARSCRRPRIGRIAVGALTFCAALLIEMPVAQASCSLLDLSCVTSTTTDAVDDVVDTATGTADDVVQDLTETTESATDAVDGVVVEVVTTVEETVEEVVTTVEQTVVGVVTTVEQTVVGVVTTVEETVDGVTTDPPAGVEVDEDVPSDRPGEDPGRDAALAPGEGTTEVTGGMPTMAAGSAGSALAGSASNTGDAPAGIVSDGTTLAPAGASATEASALEGATQNDPSAEPSEVRTRSFGFANAVTVLAFPMALSIVVALFLLAQHRLDRRAPKLALAPVEPDVLGF